MAKRISLVTGGAGFIGSHLSEELLSKGQRVIAIDDLSTSTVSNIQHLFPRSGFTFRKGSIRDRRLIGPIIKKCDIVYHLAASVGVKYVLEHPLRALRTNVEGSCNVMDLCDKYKKKIVLISSSEVYGKGTGRPFSEDDDHVFGTTKNIRWGYPASKAINEFYALAYFREREMKGVILRLFNTSGPRQTGRYGMVIPRFVKQALSGEDITVYEPGSQTRCFAHVKDTVKMIYQASSIKKTEGDIYNIGSDKKITIMQLAEKIKKRAGSNSNIVLVPYKEAYGRFSPDSEEMLFRKPDLAKLRGVIGYRSRYSIDDIIDDIIAQYQRREGHGQERPGGPCNYIRGYGRIS